MRKCFNLNYCTRVNIFCDLSKVDRLRSVIYQRMLNFNKALRICNPVTNFLSQKFFNDATSYIQGDSPTLCKSKRQYLFTEKP